MRRFPLLACFLAVFAAFPFLTSGDEPSLAKPSEESFTRQAWEDFKSPVTTDAKYILLSGAAATAMLVYVTGDFDRSTTSDAAQKKRLGRFAKTVDLAGQLIPNGLYIGGMLADGFILDKPRSKNRAYLMLRSTVHAVVVTTVLKRLVNEPRPNDNNDRLSFPSGHSTSSFAFASVIGAEHEWYFGVPAYALAAVIAYGRMNDNRHYLHDVVAGMAIGMSYGLGIYYRERARTSALNAADPSAVSTDLHLLPMDDLSGVALVLRKRL